MKDEANSLFIALTNPVSGKEDEYNEWYTNTHLEEVVAIEGFISARRYRLSEAQMFEDQAYQYLAIYEVENGCGSKIIENLESAIPLMTISSAIDLDAGLGLLVESISDTVAQQVSRDA